MTNSNREGVMAEPEVTRHPLGLPAGSVRSVLAFIITGLFWVLLLMPEEKRIPIPLFLFFNTAVVLLFFFAHGRTIRKTEDERSPWGLPRGSIRFVILAGTAAVFGLHYYLYQSLPLAKLVPQLDNPKQWTNLLIALAAGLGSGWLIGHGPWRDSAAFMDIQAWVSLIAMLGLAAEIVFLLFINPGLSDEMKVNLSMMECVLTGIVSWYFGARS
jgi:hypothetical protein